MSLGDFQFLFTPEDLAKIDSKLALVSDEATMVAEDDREIDTITATKASPIAFPTYAMRIGP